MNKEIVRQLQLKQIEIMDVIHEICTNNGIRYYLIGGSCLGAVRHKGFIPWDVDIDIAMPREDYDIFFSSLASKLPSNLIAHTYKTDEIFDKSHGLVCMKDTVLLTQSDLENPTIPRFGIFVDVMPLDKCPDSISDQKKHKQDYLMIKKMRKTKLVRIYKADSFLKRMVKHVMRGMFFWVSVKTINRWQEKVMKRYADKKDAAYWCSMASHFSYEKQHMRKEIYGQPTLMDFEDRQYYCPEQPDMYLKRLYGDYMRLPNQNDQERMYQYYAVAKW